ncbi:putative adenylylsulfatase [Rosa chinensis]|uniref:Putative adenylylsulfatase n=1 Tax=Rosa chinensis TaxID=74649 RepID=A0A2P6RWA6_ROSCH|nr:putative adenylylsulfatase [Rosa chinensis]
MALESHSFGSYKIDSREVFYDTNLSDALVNLRSVVSGGKEYRNCPRTFWSYFGLYCSLLLVFFLLF